MKQTDIDRLKAICEKEGFEVKSDLGELFHITKKDPWDGVEFAEMTSSNVTDFTQGKIYKINRIEGRFGDLECCYDDKLSPFNGASHKHFTPSTEQAYVNQLKDELFKRFGSVDVNDLDYSELGIWRSPTTAQYVYIKESDTLYFYGTPVYSEGKWAKKKVERLELFDCDLSNEGLINNFKFRVKNAHRVTKNREEIMSFMSNQLEKYLNDEK